MSKRLRFVSRCCPICNDPKTCYWHHGTGEYKNKFASAEETNNGELYIYDDGTIECEICHQRDNIENWRFECGNHAYENPSKMEIMKMISIACSCSLGNEVFWANIMRNLARS